MHIPVEEVTRSVTIAIMHPQGALDSSNYRDLVTAAEQIKETGRDYVLIDLSDVHYMSSAGIVALNLIGKLYLGEKPPEQPVLGWQALQEIKKERKKAQTSKHVKIFNPQEQVEQVLDMVGYNKLFQIFKDREAALASYQR